MIKKAKTLFFSLLPVLFALIIFFVVVLFLQSNLDRQAQIRCEEVCDYITTNVNSELENVVLLSSVFQAKDKYTAILEAYDHRQTPKQDDVFALKKEINDFLSLNSIAEDLMIYFPKTGYVVGRYGGFTMQQYYKINYPTLDKNSVEQYQSWMQKVLEKPGKHSFLHYDAVLDTSDLYYYRSYPAKEQPENCNVIILLLVDKEALKQSFGIYCESYSVSKIQIKTAEGMLYTEMQNTSVISNDYTVTAEVAMPAWNLNVIVEQEYRIAYAPLINLRSMIMIAILFIFLLMLASLFVSFRISSTKANEYNKKMSTLFFSSILTEESLNEVKLNEKMQLYNQQLKYPWFAFYVFGNDAHKELDYYLSVKDCQVFDMAYEDIVFVLLNYQSEETKTRYLDAVKLELGEVPCNQSTVFSNVLSLREVFSELYFTQFKKPVFSTLSKDSLVTKDFFVSEIRNGNLRSAGKMIPLVHDWAKRLEPGFLGQCERDSFIFELSKTEHFADQPEVLIELYKDKTAVSWGEVLTNSLNRKSNDVLNGKVEPALTAMKIMEICYADGQLDLAMIAEHVGVSQSHLSRVFKSKYDIGLIQMLTIIRINKAKELLRQGNESIGKIADQCGFSSDSALIHAFKRIEGITPGEYRSRKKTDS